MNRNRRARLAQETLEILERGAYEVGGESVAIGADLERCRAETESYPPDRAPTREPGRPSITAIHVTGETTLQACHRLAAAGRDLVALNFASAKNPGGGFLGGAQAQEESLARSSGLYAAIAGNPMYAFHRARKDALYTHYALYSPGVPVFRDDSGALLPEPYGCAIVTAPAVNAGVVLERDPGRRDEVERAMKERIDKVLAIGAHHGHDAFVLGAWGCGVFGNRPAVIARLFAHALCTTYAGAFAEVVFAVVDRSRERRFIGPFEEVFAV